MLKSYSNKLLSYFLFFSFFTTVSAENHSGTIGSETWTLANSPHVIIGNVTIVGQLTIEAGCTVQFNSGRIIDSGGGRLVADAESGNEIIFTGVNNNHFQLFPRDHIFDYCQIQNVRLYLPFGIGPATISNCTFSNCYPAIESERPIILCNPNSFQNCRPGIVIYNGDNSQISNQILTSCNDMPIRLINSPNVTITNCNISNCNWPISIDMRSHLNSSSYLPTTGNNENAINIGGGTSSDVTWHDFGIPYLVTEAHIEVYSGHTLTIDPGVTVKLHQTRWFGINGTLDVNGVAGNEVVYTECTTNQGWAGLYFTSGSSGDLQYCRIEKGQTNGQLNVVQATLTMNQCTVQNMNRGLFCDGSSPTLNNCVFINNLSDGVKLTNGSVPNFGSDASDGNNIYGNAGYQLYNGQSNNITAENIYWGTADEVTIDSYIYDDNENVSNGNVDFSPWVSYSETNMASTDSTISFNESGDGHAVDLYFSSVSGSGNVTVRQTNEQPPDAPCFNVCDHYLIIEIDESITSFSVNITFHYTDADASGYNESSAFFGIAKFNSTTNTWQWLGGTVDATNNTVTVSGITSFSTFALFRRIFGDITGDGYVDAADLQRLGDCWHATNSGEFTGGSDARFFNYNKNTDAGNQIIDAADLQVFGDCWHNGVQP
ncbi:right-handed parallel beta-helix repeat-containing protein [candidate division KSB1 bacterium]|nr:right-handed parallel beta-helix repeat-containing protein [candidate division KSB1 bacterium]MBL7094891.1 right-handed parallel beta-helix repeat-containing protein [candidate division KSB1 bacterium]